MAQPITEMFGNFIYSPELSYNDLLAIEANLKDEISEVLQNNNGEHINFDVRADSIQVQCSFDHHNEHFFHKVCDHILPFLKDQVEAKLLFIHRDLSVINIYILFNGDWHESSLGVPHMSAFEDILHRHE